MKEDELGDLILSDLLKATVLSGREVALFFFLNECWVFLCGCFKNSQPSEVVSRETTMTCHSLGGEERLLRTQHSFENDGSSKSSTRLSFKNNAQCQGYFSTAITLIRDQ